MDLSRIKGTHQRPSWMVGCRRRPYWIGALLCFLTAFSLSLDYSEACHPLQGASCYYDTPPERSHRRPGHRNIQIRGGSLDEWQRHHQNPYHPIPQDSHYDEPVVEYADNASYAEEEPFEFPKVWTKDMALALRLTSEWNRRLIEGVLFSVQSLPSQEGRSLNTPRGGSHPVNVHPSRAWEPPIPVGEIQPTIELTLFHAKDPREAPVVDGNEEALPRGVARWGPEMQPYLEHIVSLLGITRERDDKQDGSYQGLEIPLAMMYLDRACSVETPRSNGVPALPYCTPRTVHRLSLAALLVATQAVHGGHMETYLERVQSLGIPKNQLEQMVDWLILALGDPGLSVTIPQMKSWSERWNSIFRRTAFVERKSFPAQ